MSSFKFFFALYLLVTSDRKPSVDLDPNHRLLIAEATKKRNEAQSPLTKLIEEAASPEAKALVGIVEGDLG